MTDQAEIHAKDSGGAEREGHFGCFFSNRKNIEENEELVSRIQEEGHLIGKLDDNHVCLNQISKIRAKEEIEKTSK